MRIRWLQPHPFDSPRRGRDLDLTLDLGHHFRSAWIMASDPRVNLEWLQAARQDAPDGTHKRSQLGQSSDGITRSFP
jgi:hypothetical protein